MKHWLLAAALICLGTQAQASPYFRLIDPSHPHFGAGFLISPKDPTNTAGITDLAIITHSTADGTIIPATWQTIIPPESWVPFQIGFGGSFKGEAVVAPGTSANIAPIIASLTLRGVDQNSAGWARAVKTALMGTSGGGVRLGGSLAGVMVREGHFQSFKAAFPGQGFAEIVSNSARIDVGYAWSF